MSRSLLSAEEYLEVLVSWREGDRIYVSSQPLGMTSTDAREAAGQLLDHADAIERRPEVAS